MPKAKVAISIDEELFREADKRAGKMNVSRSEFYERAVAKFVRDQESREITERLNESYADGPDEEDRAALKHMQSLQRQALENNEW